jgi:hypothetical protein
MKKLRIAVSFLTLSLLFFTKASLAQNFSSAESGGFKRADSVQLQQLLSKEITLRRVGTGLNDDLIFKGDGEFIVSGYTRNFVEKGKWRLDGELICMERPSSKACRFLYLNDEKFRLVTEKGEIRGEGSFKR